MGVQLADRATTPQGVDVMGYDEFAVSIVVNERVAMRLTGEDKEEAIRRLSALALPAQDLLDLVMWPVSSGHLAHYRHRHAIPNPVFPVDHLSRAALGMDGPPRRRNRKPGP